MRAGGELSDEADRTLEAYRTYYPKVTSHLRELVAAIVADGFPEADVKVAARPKTWPTTLDKLRRDRFTLDRIRDLIGVRIVMTHPRATLSDQDRIAQVLLEAFPGSKLIDRRAQPSEGYRALHVELRSHECRAEVQVRTRRQQEWAEISEATADRWGRELRYGQPPLEWPEERQRGWASILEMAEVLAQLEEVDDALASAGALDLLRITLRRPATIPKVLRVRTAAQQGLKVLRETVDAID